MSMRLATSSKRFLASAARIQRQKQIAFFNDDTGFEFAVSNLFNSPPPTYPPDFHIGFILERTSEVREIYERLRAAAVAMKLDMGEHGPNLVFQCIGPDSIPVE